MNDSTRSSTEVLVCGARFDPLDIEERILGPRGAQIRRASGDDAASIRSSGRGATAILAGSAPRFTREVFEGLPDLRLLVRYGIGVDRIDLNAAANFGIQVCNVTDYCTDEVATHAVMLVLASTRRLPAALATTVAHGWGIAEVQPIEAPDATEVAVLGLGRIGRATAERLRALGFRVRGYDPYVPRDTAEAMGIVHAATLKDALEGAHVASLHLPLSETTRHIVSTNEIATMREGAYVINVSRGGLVDEEALLAALASGHVRGAALDVLEEEPPSDSTPLVGHPRVMVTPHMAWYSVQAQTRMRQLASEEVARFLAGEPLQNPLVEGLEGMVQE